VRQSDFVVFGCVSFRAKLFSLSRLSRPKSTFHVVLLDFSGHKGHI
jgi:hypothetical protein